MAPQISVIMPIYNGERFLGKAIESILNQAFTDFELIAVDDGSTDRSLEILQAFAERDSRVRLHRMPVNGGAVAARNAGTQLSRGKFIAIMDADDVSLPNRLDRQRLHLEQNPDVGVVGTYVQLIDGDDKPGAIKTFPSTPALMGWSMLFFNCLAHPSVMIRREILLAVEGYAAKCKGGTEDYDLFVRVSRLARLATIPEVLVLYRQWGGNMTQRAWESQEQDATRIVQEMAAALLGTEVSDRLAARLRGMATNAYPRTADDIGALGHLILQLFRAYAQQPWLTRQDQQTVARDAGIKIWLLASLAAFRSPALASSLGASAVAISPSSLPAFVAKAAKRLATKR